MGSSNFDAIAAFIKTTLEGIADIGVVHRSEKKLESQKDFQDFLGNAGVVDRRTFVITRPTWVETPFDNGGTVLRVHNFIVYGIQPYKEGADYATSSEKSWNDIIEAISDAFQDPHVFEGVANAGQVDVVTLSVNEKRFWQPNNNLVHYAEIALRPQEVIEI